MGNRVLCSLLFIYLFIVFIRKEGSVSSEAQRGEVYPFSKKPTHARSQKHVIQCQRSALRCRREVVCFVRVRVFSSVPLLPGCITPMSE